MEVISTGSSSERVVLEGVLQEVKKVFIKNY